jgi:ribosomal protein L11 methylase PrmA
MIWDLGANTGEFSRVAAETGALVVAFDIDPAAIERNYLEQRAAGGGPILPLLLDLTNPSPGIGWANRERDVWDDRARPDAVLALALIHHLAIGNNLPLPEIARLLATLAPAAIVEFVPKEDSQVQRLLGSRTDIFADYNEDAFTHALAPHFAITARTPVPSSSRTLYLLTRHP